MDVERLLVWVWGFSVGAGCAVVIFGYVLRRHLIARGRADTAAVAECIRLHNDFVAALLEPCTEEAAALRSSARLLATTADEVPIIQQVIARTIEQVLMLRAAPKQRRESN
jgi:hypothetical protein